MQIQIELWQLICGIASTIVAFVLVVWAFGTILIKQFKSQLNQQFGTIQSDLTRRAQEDQKVSTKLEQIENDLEETLTDYLERIVALETKSDAALTHDDLADMHNKINEIGNDISNLSGQFNGVSTLLNTLHRHLLKGDE